MAEPNGKKVIDAFATPRSNTNKMGNPQWSI